MWPMLRVLGLGGSASVGDLEDRVATVMDLLETVLDVVDGDGPQSDASGHVAPLSPMTGGV